MIYILNFEGYGIWHHISQKQILMFSLMQRTIPAGNYMFKINYKNIRTMYEMRSILAIKTPERRHWKPMVFWCFQGVSKEISGIKWVKRKVNCLQPLIIFGNSSIIDVWQNSEYASVCLDIFDNVSSSWVLKGRLHLSWLFLFIFNILSNHGGTFTNRNRCRNSH